MKINPVNVSIKIEFNQLDPYQGKEKEGFLPKTAENTSTSTHSWTVQTYEKKFHPLSQIAYGVLAALATLTTLFFGLLIRPIQDLWKNAITGKKLYNVEKERKAQEIKTNGVSKNIFPEGEKHTQVSNPTISQDSQKPPGLDLALQKQSNQQQLIQALNLGDMRTLANLMDQPLETLRGVKRADGTTVLHLFVESGDKILVEKALKKGAEIEALRSGLRSYENAFHLAILHGFIDMVELMVKHDKNREDYQDAHGILHHRFAGFSPLILALREDLISQVRAHSTSSLPRSHPLEVAARLLALGADPREFFEGTETFFAIKQAVYFKDIKGREQQHLDLIKAFLQRGASDLRKMSPEGYKNNYFQSAIYHAVRDDLVECVKVLIENDNEKHACFGIYEAVQSVKSKKMLELFIGLASNDGLLKLIREGLDANNNNLLHSILQENWDFLDQKGIDLELITFCLDLQISPLKENRNGRTALEVAITLFNKAKNDPLKENIKEMIKIFLNKIDLRGFNRLEFKQKYKFITHDVVIQNLIDPLHEVGEKPENLIEI